MDMRRLSYILLAVSSAWAMTACTEEKVEKFEFKEFGISQSEIQFPAKIEYSDGKVVSDLKKEIRVLSNQECVISYVDGIEADWMRIRDLDTYQVCRQIAFDGDCSFRIECDQNDDYARMVKLLVQTSSRTDTVYVKQLGKREPSIKLASGSLVLNGSTAGNGEVVYTSNISDYQDIKYQISYSGEEGWIDAVSIDGDKVKLDYKANPSSDNLRTASVKVYYTDGFGTEYGQTLYVIQKTGNDGIGKTMSFADVRAMGKDGQTVEINDYLIVEGYVVSNRASGNVGENEKLSLTASDNTSYKKKFYLESLDGNYGFLVQTATEEDNVFTFADKVTLLLKGTSLTKETDPERYEITGLTSSNIVGRETGFSSNLPEREKFISELTDADIYTYITLKDCEFAVRKGALTPLNDAYTLSSGKGMISKYPRLVRDAEGSSIYTYTNTTCPYRRDGVRLPYGSGTLSGVIVHELFPNYVYGDNDDEELSGNIGRYQIRHQSYSDIAFDKENSFSHILAEFRYATGFRTGENGMSYFNATDGQASARFFHTSGDAVTNCPSTFNYIGWTGTNSGVAPFKSHIGFDSSIDQPLGYSFADGYVFDYSGTNSDGKGKVSSTKKNTYNGVSVKLYDGWMSKIWWKDEDAPAESWIVEFSTKDIAAQHLSMQFTSYSAITSNVGNAPYNWTVSWSDTFDLNDESVWKKVADYVVPDGVLNGQEREWQLPAFKQYDFVLPLEMLGKDKVYLRLRPASRVSNTLYFGEGTVTDGTQSGNGIDYFAIRYN